MDGPILINKNKGVKGNIYMSMFEKKYNGPLPKVMSYIIKMKIIGIMTFLISNV